MITLCIRTDNPTAELHLYEDGREIATELWEGHRQLGETLHVKIRDVLNRCAKDLHGVDKIVIFQGPGSFTGLRIGVSVANALAYSLRIPVVGADGDDWIECGLQDDGSVGTYVQPLYGQEPHITQQKK